METSVYKQVTDQLFHSAAAGDVERVKAALKVLPDVNVTDQRRWTALMLAARNGHVDTVKLLLDAGSDLSIINKSGQTAADIAAFWNHTEVVDLLRGSGDACREWIIPDFLSRRKAVSRGSGVLDLASMKRKDRQWIEAQLMNDQSKLLIFVGLKALVKRLQNELHVNGDASLKLVTVNAKQIPDILMQKPLVIFLGLEKQLANQEQDDIAWFAIGLDRLSNEMQQRIEPQCTLMTILPGVFFLSEKEGRIFSQASSLIAWHDRYAYCPTCGGMTSVEDGGHRRTCLNEHCRSRQGVHNMSYPRTDPAVVVAVVSPDRSKLLLARGVHFPKLTYSCLSGFMEPGESSEDTVKREVYEECSIRVDHVQYYADHHWSASSTLLIGCFAQALNTDIKRDPEELVDARWFSRKEVLQMLTHNHPLGLSCPPKQTLAHQLIKTWITATSKL